MTQRRLTILHSQALSRPGVPPSGRVVRRAGGRGFSLIEILVVMGIIVLLIALALPAFNFITGSRSTEAAGNQISAAMGVARADAVGLQKVCGVMFFLEPTSDKVQLGLVQEVDRPSAPDTENTNVDVYLDLVPDTEFVKLPVGVGVQTVTNALVTGVANRDRYIGFNTVGVSGGSTPAAQTGLVTRVGGVILFDGNGQLKATTYALRTRLSNTLASRMGALLFYDPDATVADNASVSHTPVDYIPVSTANASTVGNLPVSQLGFVLFDSSAFMAKDFRLDDERVSGVSDLAKESWLDENGTPTMINRFNGTLVRGE